MRYPNISNPQPCLVFFTKQKHDIYSFKLIEYIEYNHIFNVTKNEKGKSTIKLTTHKLIAYNDKMLRNMTKSEYTFFRICNFDDTQVIDCIYAELKIINQPDSNKHNNKTRNQNNIVLRRRTKQRCTKMIK
jgi:hypothetical protein